MTARNCLALLALFPSLLAVPTRPSAVASEKSTPTPFIVATLHDACADTPTGLTARKHNALDPRYGVEELMPGQRFAVNAAAARRCPARSCRPLSAAHDPADACAALCRRQI